MSQPTYYLVSHNTLHTQYPTFTILNTPKPMNFPNLSGVPLHSQIPLLLNRGVRLWSAPFRSSVIESLVTHVEGRCDDAYSHDKADMKDDRGAEVIDVPGCVLFLAM